MTVENSLETNIQTQNPAEYHELNPTGKETILLLGGITEGQKTQAGFSQALADEGFRVISFDYTHDSAADPSDTDEAYFPRYHTQKVEQTISILDQTAREDEKIILVGHSQGSVMAVEAALARPDKVERLILNNPSGLFSDKFARTAGRFATETLRKSLTPKKLAMRQQIQGTKDMVAHPKAFLGDAVDISHADIRGGIHRLRALGITVDAFISAKDRVFPGRLILEGISPNQKLKPEDIVVDSISSYFNTKQSRRGKVKQHKFASKWAGHDQSIIYPKQTAKLIKQIVNNN